MIKKHKEYLIIPIANIKAKDNSNILYNNSNIATNHQKIVLKLSNGYKSRHGDISELITKEPFYFKDSLFNIMYKGKPCDNMLIESDNLLINIHPRFVTIDEVKAFFDEIIACKEASYYEEFVSNLLLNSKKVLTKKKHYL